MSKENKDLEETKDTKKNPKKTKKTKPKKGGPNKKINLNPGDKASKKNLILVSGAALLLIGISAVVFITLTSLFSTESYYVLNTNIKAKQQITTEMVEPRETAEGTGPVHALSMEEIQRGSVYSKYPLFAGDVVAKSNAGPLSGTQLGIPDDWSVTSFTINSTDAVGGILGKGDYVDLIGVGERGSQYVFNNMLILEVKFLNEEIDGELDGETVVGETMHYTVGLPGEHIANLHSALHDYDTVKMIKAPNEVNYAERDTSDLDKLFKYSPDVGNIDVFEGSDPTFTEVERDEDGRPINEESQSENEDETDDVDETQEIEEDEEENEEDEEQSEDPEDD